MTTDPGIDPQASSTSTKNLPWPLGTDLVRDGDDAIRKLAQSVDNMVQAGTASVNVTTGGQTSSQAVTFPVPFAAVPVVTATIKGGGASPNLAISISGESATGFTAYAQRATSGPVDFAWHAVGRVVTVT